MLKCQVFIYYICLQTVDYCVWESLPVVSGAELQTMASRQDPGYRGRLAVVSGADHSVVLLLLNATPDAQKDAPGSHIYCHSPQPIVRPDFRVDVTARVSLWAVQVVLASAVQQNNPHCSQRLFQYTGSGPLAVI